MNQLVEWMRYDEIEPIDSGREEIRHGVLCSLIANINRNSDMKPDPFDPEDFMWRIEAKKLQQMKISEKHDRVKVEQQVESFFSGLK